MTGIDGEDDGAQGSKSSPPAPSTAWRAACSMGLLSLIVLMLLVVVLLVAKANWGVLVLVEDEGSSRVMATAAAAASEEKPSPHLSISSPSPLCERPFLIILGTGRSGSTSVLEMLNLIPQLHLRGETGLMGKSSYVDQLGESKGLQFGAEKGAWEHSKLDPVPLYTAVQDTYIAMNQISSDERSISHIVYGMKEVSWEPSKFDLYFHNIFPCAKVIVNVRKDLEAQRKSAFYKKLGRANDLRQRTNALLALHEKLGPKRSFLIELEAFSVDIFNQLLDWVGISGCNFSSVLHANPHNSYKPAKTSDLEQVLQGECFLRESSYQNWLANDYL
jgi:hypothetical protein